MTRHTNTNRRPFVGCSAAILVAAAWTGSIASPSHAGIVVYFQDPDVWKSVVGTYTTIDFVLGSAQILTDQYADKGILFPGGNDIALAGSPTSFEDGWGMKPNGLTPPLIEVAFTQPQTAFMIKYPGITGFTLLSGGVPIWSGSGGAAFGPKHIGVISTIPFDAVHITSTIGKPVVDDLFFASAVPGPASAPLLAAMFVGGRRRRRR